MQIENFPENVEVAFSQEEVEQSIKQLAENVSERLKDENPIVISILHGGLIFSADLMKQFQFAFQQDYLHATRYANELCGGELLWKAEPSLNLQNRTILLLDDVYDEGNTLTAIHKYCESKKAKKVYSAVLVNKIKQRAFTYEPDFSALQCEDKYLFGMGMDYKGYWRSSSCIYALNE